MSDILCNRIKADLGRSGYSTFSLVDIDVWERCREEFYKLMNLSPTADINLQDGMFDSVQVKRLSGLSGSSAGYEEAFKAIYIPLHHMTEIEHLQFVASKLITLQNIFFCQRVDFGLGVEDDFFPAVRIHLYKKSDFIGPHVDTHFIRPYIDSPFPMAKFAFPISSFGIDFNADGFFVEGGDRKYLDQLCVPGSAVAFDGSLTHGLLAIGGSDSSWRAQLFVNYYAKLVESKDG